MPEIIDWIPIAIMFGSAPFIGAAIGWMFWKELYDGQY